MLACICADGTKIPIGLIYQGESHDLQDSWVEDVDDSDEVYFAALDNGWTCDSLGLQWLEKIFDRHTKANVIGVRPEIGVRQEIGAPPSYGSAIDTHNGRRFMKQIRLGRSRLRRPKARN